MALPQERYPGRKKAIEVIVSAQATYFLHFGIYTSIASFQGRIAGGTRNELKKGSELTDKLILHINDIALFLARNNAELIASRGPGGSGGFCEML